MKWFASSMNVSTLMLMALLLPMAQSHAFDETVLESVVRIKPDWPAAARGLNAQGAPRDPQGTGFAVLSGGYIATNMHVIGAAKTVMFCYRMVDSSWLKSLVAMHQLISRC